MTKNRTAAIATPAAMPLRAAITARAGHRSGSGGGATAADRGAAACRRAAPGSGPRLGLEVRGLGRRR